MVVVPIQSSPVVLHAAIIRETDARLKADAIDAGRGGGDMQLRHDQWGLGGGGGLWFAPVSLGLLLILFGVLVFARPELLAYLVAAVLVVVGGLLVGVGWHLRRRVTYRRMDEDDDVPGPLGS
jgi:hypothetical protein